MPQISETAHRTLGLACGFGTVGLPIGAHFHPNPQPPPIPQQLGEKAHLRIAWTVGDFMLLFARWQPTMCAES